jgi:hypothetical protein
MKKTLFSIIFIGTILTAKSQTVLSDFESVTLPSVSNHVYNGSSGGNGFSSGDAFFETVWDTSYGGFWSSGWAASSVQDSVTAGAANQYGCAALKGYNNSMVYAVGTTFGNLTVRFSGSSLGKPVYGVYVCNSTMAAKSMETGDMFAKKFGGTTGNDPDWFKLQVKRYYGGVLQADTVDVYLADYRFSNNAQDYILKTWTWIDLRKLGTTDTIGFTDSLAFYLTSSDNGSFGMNTPAYFCVDNLITNSLTTNAIQNFISDSELNLFPNPANNFFEVAYQTESPSFVNLKMTDATGRELLFQNFRSFNGLNKFKVDTQDLPAGIYYVTLNVEGKIYSKKLIKQ